MRLVEETAGVPLKLGLSKVSILTCEPTQGLSGVLPEGSKNSVSSNISETEGRPAA